MDNQQGPLDKFLQENSIMYKGVDGNAFNTQLDEYYIQKGDYLYQNGPNDNGNDDCQPCFNPNPPNWCFNPNSPCYDSSIPVDGDIHILIFAGVILAALTLRSRFLVQG